MRPLKRSFTVSLPLAEKVIPLFSSLSSAATAVASVSVKTPFLTKRSRSASLEPANAEPIRAAESAVSCVSLYNFIVCMCLDVLQKQRQQITLPLLRLDLLFVTDA